MKRSFTLLLSAIIFIFSACTSKVNLPTNASVADVMSSKADGGSCAVDCPQVKLMFAEKVKVLEALMAASQEVAVVRDVMAVDMATKAVSAKLAANTAVKENVKNFDMSSVGLLILDAEMFLPKICSCEPDAKMMERFKNILLLITRKLQADSDVTYDSPAAAAAALMSLLEQKMPFYDIAVRKALVEQIIAAIYGKLDNVCAVEAIDVGRIPDVTLETTDCSKLAANIGPLMNTIAKADCSTAMCKFFELEAMLDCKCLSDKAFIEQMRQWQELYASYISKLDMCVGFGKMCDPKLLSDPIALEKLLTELEARNGFAKCEKYSRDLLKRMLLRVCKQQGLFDFCTEQPLVPTGCSQDINLQEDMNKLFSYMQSGEVDPKDALIKMYSFVSRGLCKCEGTPFTQEFLKSYITKYLFLDNPDYIKKASFICDGGNIQELRDFAGNIGMDVSMMPDDYVKQLLCNYNICSEQGALMLKK